MKSTNRWLSLSKPFQISGAFLALLLVTAPSLAKVTRIVIDSRAPFAPVTGQTMEYEEIRGRAFGELDPNDSHNSVITDILLGTDSDGKVRYEAKFQLMKPTNMATANGFMWHDVPNRGGQVVPPVVERNAGDIFLRSGWQADNSGNPGVTNAGTAIPAVRSSGTNFWVAAPRARQNGQLVTGTVLARIVNQTGPASQPLIVQSNPVPYVPTTLDTSKAVLKTHISETVDGKVTEGSTISSGDWAWANCSASNPFPGTPINIDPEASPGNLPLHICVKGGFQPGLLYEVVYPATNAYVLGVGMAAFRDVGTFFRNSLKDDAGTANPVAGAVKGAAIRGSSQSGNMARQFLFMGMNQDEANRKVFDGAWPIIAGRRVAANVRFGQPDGVLELYQMGSEGPQWWVDWPDTARNLPAKSIFTRCNTSNTCPKIIEHFGSAEIFALKLSPEWVGTSGDADIPLTRNVRRYYVPGSTHGGGAGGFNHIPTVTTAPNCPGNNFGRGTYLANPTPSTELVNVLREAMRDWVLKGTSPPPSRWPTITGRTLVAANKSAMGFPSGVPGVPDSIFLPQNFAFPVLDYDWGPQYDRSEASGVPTKLPPPILKVIPPMVPKVNADGNEIGGVPTVLNMAPLGTYLGWNLTQATTAAGVPNIHAGQVCNYVGGYIPFAKTRSERIASGDPRLSLEERYSNYEGYVAAVRAAADSAFSQGFLLATDRDLLIKQATDSTVLR